MPGVFLLVDGRIGAFVLLVASVGAAIYCGSNAKEIAWLLLRAGRALGN